MSYEKDPLGDLVRAANETVAMIHVVAVRLDQSKADTGRLKFHMDMASDILNQTADRLDTELATFRNILVEHYGIDEYDCPPPNPDLHVVT